MLLYWPGKHDKDIAPEVVEAVYILTATAVTCHDECAADTVKTTCVLVVHQATCTCHTCT